MSNFLYKVNKIQTHNHIVRLEEQNAKQQKKFDELSEKCKDLMTEYDTKYQKKLLSMNKQIDKLKKENNNLKAENSLYKSALKKIPKFILNLFIGKNKLGE